MAARRGDMAKQLVTEKIVQAFGDSIVCIQDKKIYINIIEGNETVQIAVSLTMPKTPVAAAQTVASQDGSNDSVSVAGNAQATSTELAPEDRAKIEELKVRLGITD